MKTKKHKPTLSDVAKAAHAEGLTVSVKMVPKEDCCASCKFSCPCDPREDESPDRLRCRRYPREYIANVGYHYRRHFRTDWCGEFRRVET